MENILRDSFGKFKSFKINLLDGQRRGEVLFRRVFVLIVLFLVTYLLLLAFVGKKDQNASGVDAVEIGVDHDGIVYKEGEVVNGQEVVVDGGKAYFKQEYKEEKKDPVKEYIKSYGGRINDDYLTSLRKYCNEETLKLVVAISVAETSMGKNTDNKTNFYGYFYGGDRGYDPSVEEMSRVICKGISKYYSNVNKNKNQAKRYTGGDNVGVWMGNVNIALSKMK